MAEKTPKLTLNSSTPGADATNQAKSEYLVKDAKGRTITLKKPNVLAQFRLVKMLGDAAKNMAYMSMVTPLTYVIAIDGDPVSQPSSERELDALIQRLDDYGFMAVVDGIQESFGTDEVQQAEALKNF